MTIIVNKDGDMFLEFTKVSEEELLNPANYNPLTVSLIIVKHQKKFLLVFNKFKRKWELPGGMIDEGEHPRDCASRELMEETNQAGQGVNFNGIMKFCLQPDKRIEFGALYSCQTNKIVPFKENDEVEKITFWDAETDIGYIDEIDKKLIDFYQA